MVQVGWIQSLLKKVARFDEYGSRRLDRWSFKQNSAYRLLKAKKHNIRCVFFVTGVIHIDRRHCIEYN